MMNTQCYRMAGRLLIPNLRLASSNSFRPFGSCPHASDKTFLSTQRASSSASGSTVTASPPLEMEDESNAKPYSEIPGDWKGTLPLLDAMPIFLPYIIHKGTAAGAMRSEDFMRDYYEKYGKESGIARFGSSAARVVLIFDDGYLKVFEKEGKHPAGILTGAWPVKDYNRMYVDGNPKNPFTQDGEDWRKGRMAVNPYLFNIKEAHSYLPSINETAKSASEHFEKYAVSGNIARFCELAAFDMFTAASLGLQINSVGGDPQGLQSANDIIGSLASMGNVTNQCPYSNNDMLKFSSWDKFAADWSKGREAGKELMHQALKEGKGNGKGIMHGFLGDENLKISSEEATEMYLMLTFAAADTTSSLINNVLTNLAKHPDVQDKVRAELVVELGGKDYQPEDVTLKYFEQVLKETQRLTPPLAFTNVKNKFPREMVVNGYRIPADTTYIFSHIGIATDERLAGPNPQQFDPNRFSEDNVTARKGTKAAFLDHPLACKPFGFGARMCVGSRIAKLEYMSILCRLIQDYAITIDEEKSVPERERLRLSNPTTVEYPSPVFQVTKL